MAFVIEVKAPFSIQKVGKKYSPKKLAQISLKLQPGGYNPQWMLLCIFFEEAERFMCQDIFQQIRNSE